MHAKCVLLWATFGATLWTTSHSCAAMSHALAADARQMCAAMSHVWCNSREDNCAFFWAAFLLPFQLCSTQDRLENSLSIYIFGILNLTCYFPYDPGWVGQTCFCWRTIAPFFGLHSSSRLNSDMPKKNRVACWSQLRGVRLVRQRKLVALSVMERSMRLDRQRKVVVWVYTLDYHKDLVSLFESDWCVKK